METAFKARGYQIVDKPGADTLTSGSAADLRSKKKRGILAYTPVGFVVDAAWKALQGSMTK